MLAPYAGAALPDVEVSPADRFMLIFTSGTTGAPKAVMMSQGRLCGWGTRLATNFGLSPDDVCYSVMPLFHSNAAVAGFTNIVASGAIARAAPPLLGERLAGRRAQVRRHVLQLRRQAADVHPRDARATRRRRQPVELRVRQRGRAARHRPLRAAVRLHRRRRVRLDRGRREHEQVDRHAARRARQAGRRERRRAHPRPRDERGVSARGVRRDGPVRQRRGGDRRDGERRRARAGSRATTTTTRPTPSACAAACTGPATSATATRTGSSTSRAATPTGCASTARTSRPRRSRTCSPAIPRSCSCAVYAVPAVDVGDDVMAALHLHEGHDVRRDGVRRVPRRAGRPLTEVGAALRADQRRAAVDRDAEGAEARAAARALGDATTRCGGDRAASASSAGSRRRRGRAARAVRGAGPRPPARTSVSAARAASLCSLRHGDGTLPNASSAGCDAGELVARHEGARDAAAVERIDDRAAVEHAFGGVEQRVRREDLLERPGQLERSCPTIAAPVTVAPRRRARRARRRSPASVCLPMTRVDVAARTRAAAGAP